MPDIERKNKECIFRPEFMQLAQKKNIFGCYPKQKHIEMIREAIKNGQVEDIFSNTYGISVPPDAKLCRIWLEFDKTTIQIIAFEYPELFHPKEIFKGSNN